MHTAPLLTITGVTKIFGHLKAVDNVSLTLHSGELFALLGPNGAGKTTLIKMLTGLILPNHGFIEIAGINLYDEPERAKAVFGYVADDPTTYDYLTGEELLWFVGRMRKMSEGMIQKRLHEIGDLFPLDQKLHEPLSQYSRGNKQKVAFLAAILAQPRLLFIDEPIVGLDPKSVEIVQKELTNFVHQGGSVFLVTHSLEFAEKVATSIGILNKGKLITTSQKPKSISAFYGKFTL